MRVYFITSPYTSSGMKRTYNKDLVVYSGIQQVISEGYYIVNADMEYRYHAKTKQWRHKDTSKGTSARYVEAFTELPEDQWPQIPVFADLELAKVAKILLIQGLETEYHNALKELEAAFKRNVPDTSEPLEELKSTHPEYFL